MTDLTTTYLGKDLANPMVCSSGPLTHDLGTIKRLEDAGIAAVVMHSLFEEQIELEALDLDENLSFGTDSFGEALSYIPDMRDYNTGPDGYLDLLRRAKQSVAVPVIGSLNGTTPGGWTRYAREIQDAGADALELNIYDIPTDPEMRAEELERNLIDLVREVRGRVSIPLAVKLGPFFTAPANLIKRLSEAGASAVVLFNRFFQPDLDIDHLSVDPHLRLSRSEDLLPRLHWAGILFGRVPIEVAISGGVHTARDILKCMMAGAQVAMTTSALLRHGLDHVSNMLLDLRRWMEEHEYGSIREMRGSLSLLRVPDPSAFERGNYLKVLRGELSGADRYDWSRHVL
jgi:dihydroorotate dehydrogenase (fumarate)